jgi:hypothetical protein
VFVCPVTPLQDVTGCVVCVEDEKTRTLVHCLLSDTHPLPAPLSQNLSHTGIATQHETDSTESGAGLPLSRRKREDFPETRPYQSRFKHMRLSTIACSPEFWSKQTARSGQTHRSADAALVVS